VKVENTEGLPELLFTVLAENRPPVKGEIHVTQLIGPAMVDYLRRKHWDELVDDASNRLFALFGQGLHAAIANDGRIEHAKKVLAEVIENWYKIDSEIQLCVLTDLLKALDSTNQSGIESDLKWKLKGGKWTLVGTDDHYDELQACIMDWKITSVWSVLFAEHNWEEQLNVYGWMRRKLGYEVKQLKVWALLRDWQKSKAKYGGGGPKYPRIPFVEVEVPVWSMKKAEEYVYERLIKFEGEPEWCTPEDKWQTPMVYKVMKKGRKSAVIATVWKNGEKLNLLSVAEAMEAAANFTKSKDGKKIPAPINIDGTQHYIQEFKGECKRCADYCVVNSHCEQYLTGGCDNGDS
jgi:hypothetical protein